MIPSWFRVLVFTLAVAAAVTTTAVLLGSDWYSRRVDIALVCLCLTLPISLWDIIQHIRHVHNEALQIPLIRIIWMVPIYAIDSFLALRFESISMYVTTAREMYEAYVIYSFTIFLFRFVAVRAPSRAESTAPMEDGSMVAIVKSVLNTKAPLSHMFPLCCLRPWPMSGSCEFFDKCRMGVSQYVVIRLTASLVAMAMKMAGFYDEGNLSPKSGYLYVAIVFNFSQCWALYCLVLVYKALKPELRPMKPLSKFLCVKSVVFFSWYQSVFVELMVYINVLPKHDKDGGDMALGLQDFLICVEMLIAASIHHYVFPYDAEYLDVGSIGGTLRSESIRQGVVTMFHVKDIAQDARGVRDTIHTSLVNNAALKRSYKSVESSRTSDVH
eukprot:c17567_g1_i2.p1 GENE.c17567_g1_i2~~c17567_g1_i2.p1  ORF type:complete len:384 (+),score=86.48 c17567_g1_i2:1803-2954(+)